MKQLQNNVTTPGQSRRLLALGLPADSADSYYEAFPTVCGYFDKENLLDLPCWSVGRLIEIYEIVGENAGQCLSTDKNKSRVERLVQLYEENVTMLNFSKLEKRV